MYFNSEWKEVSPEIGELHDELYAVPELEVYGMAAPTTISSFRGGETFALNRLEKVLSEIEDIHEWY